MFVDSAYSAVVPYDGPIKCEASVDVCGLLGEWVHGAYRMAQEDAPLATGKNGDVILCP